MASTLYPRQPKPAPNGGVIWKMLGIKQLGKLDKERRERDAKVALVQANMACILNVFRQFHQKTGRVNIAHFSRTHQDRILYFTAQFIKAVALIYADIQVEYDEASRSILFLRLDCK